MITHKQRCDIPVIWKEGDTITVKGRQGVVRYIYTNGYTLIHFQDEAIIGGIFNNNSTFGNEHIN